MKLKILGISASPVREGNTVVFLKEALKAAEEMGDVETVLVTLHGEIGEKLRDCNHCNWCVRKQEEGKFCRYQNEDIMGEVYPKILEADGLLLATPTYITRLSGYMANFLDRFRCLAEGNVYRGSLEGKAVGALGILWLRNCGAETTLLSIVQGAMHLGMYPIHAMRKMSGGSYGAIGVSSLGGTGAFDKNDRLQVLKDEYGLKSARNLGQNMVDFLRIYKTGKRALAVS